MIKIKIKKKDLAEANVTTLSQMNKIPLEYAEMINNHDRKNAPVLAAAFAQMASGLFVKDTPPEYLRQTLKLWLEQGIGAKISFVLNKLPNKKQEILNLIKRDYPEARDLILNLKNDIQSQLDPSNLEPVIKYASGRKWVKLPQDYWLRCGKEMQHCGNPLAEDGEIYQLFDHAGNWDVTIEMRPNNEIVQIKGKQNQFPVEKYWPAIIDFIEKHGADNKEPLTPVEFWNSIGHG